MKVNYRDFVIRDWEQRDRIAAAEVIHSVLTQYKLGWEPEGADRDVLEVEECYLATGGEFWVVELQGQIVGTSAYYPVSRGNKAVEIRKMYLLSSVRRQGLGKFLLEKLEDAILLRSRYAIAAKGFEQIWIETASVLFEAVKLYDSSGYIPAEGVETARCDLVYVKFLA